MCAIKVVRVRCLSSRDNPTNSSFHLHISTIKCLRPAPVRSFHGPTKTLGKASSLILGECFTDSKYAPSRFLLGHRLQPMQTVIGPDGLSTTTLYRALRKSKEERVARLEWAPNGGLGRAQIGKVGRYTFRRADVALTKIYPA